VALLFEQATGIRIGKPRVAVEHPTTEDEIDFLDNHIWEGRAPELAGRLKADVVRPLLELVARYDRTTRRQAKSKAIETRETDDYDSVGPLLREAAEAAKKALDSRWVREILDPEEIEALESVWDFRNRGVSRPNGRPREWHLAALWILMAILGPLRRKNGEWLTDSDMAYLISLLCPVLLRQEHSDVKEYVRKNRRPYELDVVLTPSRCHATLSHPEGYHPLFQDGLTLSSFWPGIDLSCRETPRIPLKWRRAKAPKNSPHET